MINFIFDLFSTEEDKICRKMKKEIMSLPAIKLIEKDKLVRIKKENGFVTVYAILKKNGYVFYLEKLLADAFSNSNDLWPIMSKYKFGKLIKDVSCKKLWKTNLKDLIIIDNESFVDK